jgi:hypothetical protein
LKRKFACLPAGDFLAGLDLEDAAPGKPLDLYHQASEHGGSGGAGRGGPQAPAQPTLLELSLAALLALVGTGPAVAGQLFRLDVLGLCEALWAYTTPSVVALAQRLCAVVAER